MANTEITYFVITKINQMEMIGKYAARTTLTMLFILASGLSQVILAIPRVATNPGGKTLDQAGDSAIAWFFDDVRPWIMVLLVIVGVIGGFLGGRYKLQVAGICLGLIVGLIALPSIISVIFGWL